MEVKSVELKENKSAQEVEADLLKNHEEKEKEVDNQDPEPDEVVEDNVQADKPELTEAEIFSFIKNKYGRDITSLDELTAAKESEEMSEEMKVYSKYNKETGRGINDFVKLNREIDESDSNSLLKEYFAATEEGLDESDIQLMMEDFDYDEDIDEDADVRKVKLAKKKAVNKAKKYFNEQKEKYRVPLESSGKSLSESENEEISAYRQYIESSKTYEEETKKKRDWFEKQTDLVFGSEFKGFEFTLDDKKLTFSPGDAAELKKAQSNPQNFVSKYIGEDGLIEDAAGYHKTLSIAMNPDKFAKFFYDQGKAESSDSSMRKMKNINMSERTAPEVTSKGGTQFKSLESDSGNSLKIKSRK